MRARRIPAFDPLRASALGPLTVYWQDPGEELAVAGLGIAAVRHLDRGERVAAFLKQLETSVEEADVLAAIPFPFGPWFGGVAFDPGRPAEGAWAEFGASRWILPRVLFWNHRGTAGVVTIERRAGGSGPSIEEWTDRLNATPPVKDEPAGFGSASTSADRAGWDRQMATALEAIAQGAMEKVVLARPIHVRAGEADPIRVLARARVAVPSCTSFLVRGRDGAAFVGSTPEKLCRISGRELSTHALASSSAVDRTRTLGADDKDQREHRAVVDGIRASLAPLSETVEVASAPETVRLSYISHLRTPVHARLKEGVSAVEAILALHPTAAVGGTPREAARAFLAEQEGFDRGFYAGAIGWLGPKGADLRVGLRSALLAHDEATVFVGAGIVRGSTAEGEWNETGMKSRLMLSALGAWRDA